MKLRTRLVGGTVVLVLLFGAGVIFLMRITVVSRLEGELQRRGVSIAKFLSRNSMKPLLTENVVALQLLVEQSRAVEDDIAYVFVLDPAGSVLAHSYGESFPTDLLGANEPTATGGPQVRKLASGLGTIYDIAIGVGVEQNGRGLGTARVGLLGRTIEQGLATVLYAGAGITVVSLLLFGGIAVVVNLTVSNSLDALNEGTKALGLGDLEYRIPVTGRGEFADLARAFNLMTDNLRRSEDKLIDLNTMLLREGRERSAAENGLRRSLERYGLLFGSVSDAVYVHELTDEGRPGRIVEVNDAGCAVAGRPRDQLLGAPINRILALGADAAESAAVAARLQSGETVIEEHTLCAKGGRLVPVEVSSRSFDLDGATMVLSICRDITERKRAEEQLRRVNAELAGKNEELTQLDRLREGFVRDVSHELKTPVAKHAMQLEILRGIAEREGFSPAIAGVATVMESSIRRQQQVIRNLLGLSRLEAGARGYRREPVRLDDVLRAVIEDYQPELQARGIALETALAPTVIASDPEMLWHVFSNLLNNAIKFQKGPTGGGIAVTLAVEGDEAVVRVRDEGIGLAPEELSKVFEKFYQATASAPGSGVGLTICRMIVEGVGGRIGFESAGRFAGATAVVRLPVAGEAVPT